MKVDPSHVIVPHDGPIRYRLSLLRGCSETENGVVEEGVEDSSFEWCGVEEAARALRSFDHDEGSSSSSSDSDSPFRRLLRGLVPPSADAISQLRALRTWRASVDNDDDVHKNEPTTTDNDDNKTLAAACRLLLETAVSSESPVATRRACGACVESLVDRSRRRSSRSCPVVRSVCLGVLRSIYAEPDPESSDDDSNELDEYVGDEWSDSDSEEEEEEGVAERVAQRDLFAAEKKKIESETRQRRNEEHSYGKEGAKETNTEFRSTWEVNGVAPTNNKPTTPSRSHWNDPLLSF